MIQLQPQAAGAAAACGCSCTPACLLLCQAWRCRRPASRRLLRPARPAAPNAWLPPRGRASCRRAGRRRCSADRSGRAEGGHGVCPAQQHSPLATFTTCSIHHLQHVTQFARVCPCQAPPGAAPPMHEAGTEAGGAILTSESDSSSGNSCCDPNSPNLICCFCALHCTALHRHKGIAHL